MKVQVTSQFRLSSILNCPHCGHAQTQTIPAGACQWFYDGKRRGAVLKSKPGDCCVIWSCGTVTCPPKKLGNACGGWA